MEEKRCEGGVKAQKGKHSGWNAMMLLLVRFRIGGGGEGRGVPKLGWVNIYGRVRKNRKCKSNRSVALVWAWLYVGKPHPTPWA